jgi:mono/diheme cytochrome c family protein
MTSPSIRASGAEAPRRAAPGLLALALLAAAPAAPRAAPLSPAARVFTPWDQPAPPAPPADAELAALGQRVFRGACLGCHGEKGEGDGREGKLLPVPPRDFVAAQFLCRHTPSGSLPRDEDLFRSIRRGFRPEVGMPSFTFLSDREVYAVISFLKTLSPRWKEDEVPPPLVVPAPPRFGADGVARGAAVYKAAGCAACHGKGGRGDGPSAKTLKYDSGKPVRPADFSRPRDFKCGQRPGDIFRTLVNGMDGSPMPSFADETTDEQRWDLVQFILSVEQSADPGAAAGSPGQAPAQAPAQPPR